MTRWKTICVTAMRTRYKMLDTKLILLILYWIALSVLNCSSWRSSKDYLLLIQCIKLLQGIKTKLPTEENRTCNNEPLYHVHNFELKMLRLSTYVESTELSLGLLVRGSWLHTSFKIQSNSFFSRLVLSRWRRTKSN